MMNECGERSRINKGFGLPQPASKALSRLKHRVYLEYRKREKIYNQTSAFPHT